MSEKMVRERVAMMMKQSNLPFDEPSEEPPKRSSGPKPNIFDKKSFNLDFSILKSPTSKKKSENKGAFQLAAKPLCPDLIQDSIDS